MRHLLIALAMCVTVVTSPVINPDNVLPGTWLKPTECTIVNVDGQLFAKDCK